MPIKGNYLTLLKAILSGATIEVLEEREVDLEEGKETAAVTAAAMAVMLKQKGRSLLVMEKQGEGSRIFWLEMDYRMRG